MDRAVAQNPLQMFIAVPSRGSEQKASGTTALTRRHRLHRRSSRAACDRTPMRLLGPKLFLKTVLPLLRGAPWLTQRSALQVSRCPPMHRFFRHKRLQLQTQHQLFSRRPHLTSLSATMQLHLRALRSMPHRSLSRSAPPSATRLSWTLLLVTTQTMTRTSTNWRRSRLLAQT